MERVTADIISNLLHLKKSILLYRSKDHYGDIIYVDDTSVTVAIYNGDRKSRVGGSRLINHINKFPKDYTYKKLPLSVIFQGKITINDHLKRELLPLSKRNIQITGIYYNEIDNPPKYDKEINGVYIIPRYYRDEDYFSIDKETFSQYGVGTRIQTTRINRFLTELHIYNSKNIIKYLTSVKTDENSEEVDKLLYVANFELDRLRTKLSELRTEEISHSRIPKKKEV